VRPTTWQSYAGTIEQYARPALGGIALQRLNAAQLNSFYADLLTAGRRDGKGGLSPRTVRYVHTILRKALADAVRWNVLVRNPADAATPPSPRTPEMHVWSAREARQFLEITSGDGLRALWLLALTTGMRRGELLGLKWGDVNLDSARIAVQRSLSVLKGVAVESEPKTRRGRRSISLDTSTVAALREHRRKQAREKLLVGAGYIDGDFVFAAALGPPLHPDSITNKFQRLTSNTGLPRIRFHDLRHTHATLALAAGIHPKIISERLGHASISVTLDTYSHAVPALEEQAAEDVARLLFA
jgi:integrase